MRGCAGGQLAGIGFASDQSPQHRPAGHADDVGNHRIELDVCILQCLLKSLDVAASLANELFARAQQVAQNLGLGIRHEARSDQTMGEKICQPSGIVDVGLAPRQCCGICRSLSMTP
jgi:hypothetical protein